MLEPQEHVAVSRFLFGAGDLNPGPHTFTFAEQVLLLTEQSRLAPGSKFFFKKEEKLEE